LAVKTEVGERENSRGDLLILIGEDYFKENF